MDRTDGEAAFFGKRKRKVEDEEAEEEKDRTADEMEEAVKEEEEEEEEEDQEGGEIDPQLLRSDLDENHTVVWNIASGSTRTLDALDYLLLDKCVFVEEKPQGGFRGYHALALYDTRGIALYMWPAYETMLNREFFKYFPDQSYYWREKNRRTALVPTDVVRARARKQLKYRDLPMPMPFSGTIVKFAELAPVDPAAKRTKPEGNEETEQQEEVEQLFLCNYDLTKRKIQRTTFYTVKQRLRATLKFTDEYDTSALRVKIPKRWGSSCDGLEMVGHWSLKRAIEKRRGEKGAEKQRNPIIDFNVEDPEEIGFEGMSWLLGTMHEQHYSFKQK